MNERWEERRLGSTYHVRDQRAGAESEVLSLLSVSQVRGILPRSDLTGDRGRAESLANYKICEPGDIVLNRMSAYKGALGVSPARGLVSPDYLVMQPRPGVIPEFIAAWLKTPLGVSEMTSRLRGIGSAEVNQVRTPRVNESDLRTILLPIPPVDDQQAIADYLAHENARIDTLIEEQRRLIEMLRERRTGVVAANLGSVGGMTRLKYVSAVQTGITLSGDGDPTDTEWPYLRVANVQIGHVDLREVKTVRVPADRAAASMLKSGDVLMTEGGDIDKLGRGALWRGEVAKMLHQNHIFAVRPSDALDSQFLVDWLDGQIARTYFRTTAKQTTNLAGTNKWTLGNLPIPVPPLDEQRRVVETIKRKTTLIDTLIVESEQFIELARERRAALITAAVTGEIDVREMA